MAYKEYSSFDAPSNSEHGPYWKPPPSPSPTFISRDKNYGRPFPASPWTTKTNRFMPQHNASPYPSASDTARSHHRRSSGHQEAPRPRPYYITRSNHYDNPPPNQNYNQYYNQPYDQSYERPYYSPNSDPRTPGPRNYRRTSSKIPVPPPKRPMSVKPRSELDGHHGNLIPKGYSLKNWDPSEEPITLLGDLGLGPFHRLEDCSKVKWSPSKMSLCGIKSPEVKGSLNGISVAAFPDWGSAVNAVSQDFAEQHHLDINTTETKQIRLLGGHIAESIGRVIGHFKFQGESQVHRREFHVLRKSVYNVVLGKKFLDETKTFTEFCHRVIQRLRPCVRSGSRLFLLDESPKDHIRCSINGYEASAFPDTGSDLMLISGDFARRNNFKVHRGRKYRREVELINGSTIRTDGMVLDAELQFDAPPLSRSLDFNRYLNFAAGLSSIVSNGAKSTFVCDLHVIEDLPCDIVLSNEFIFQNQVFSRFKGLFHPRLASISLDAEKMLDDRLLFIRNTHKRSSWFFRPRRPPQSETDTIPLQDSQTWEDLWKIEEARRNRKLLFIASMSEPQRSIEQSNEDHRQGIWDRDNPRPPLTARLRSSDPNLRRTQVPTPAVPAVLLAT